MGGHKQCTVDRRLVCGQNAEWTFWVEMWKCGYGGRWAIGQWRTSRSPSCFQHKVKGLANEPAQFKGHGNGPGTLHCFLCFQRCCEWGAVPVSGLHDCVQRLARFGLYAVLKLETVIRCYCRSKCWILFICDMEQRVQSTCCNQVIDLMISFLTRYQALHR